MKNRHNSILRHGFLVLCSLIFFVPIYITYINAFKPKSEILRNPFGFSFDNLTLRFVLESGFSPYFNVIEAYWTTIVIVAGSIVCIVLFTSMLAYIMVRNPTSKFFKGFYLLMMAGLIIPPEAILLSIVQILKQMNLMFTWQGLILRNIGWYIPFSSFVFVGYIKTISKELDESAYIDGASPFIIYRKIIFPLLKPASASVIIFCFLWIWNDFVNPLIILGERGYTITIGIYRAVGQYSTAWEQIFSLVLWASFPVLLMYLFMQKNFISGLTAGSIKG